MSLGKVVENRGDSLFCQQHKMTVTAFLPWVWLGGETVVRLQKGGSSAPPWGWQPARVEISAPGSGGGGQRDAIIISLCFSLNTNGFGLFIIGMSRPLVTREGQWKEGQTLVLVSPTTAPQTSTSHCPKGTGCSDTWAETIEMLLYVSSLLGVTAEWEEIQWGCELCRVWWRQRDSRQPCASPWIECSSSESGHDCQYRQAQSKSWMSTLVQRCAKLQLLLSEQVLGKGLRDVLSWHSSGLVQFICAFILK